MRFVFLSISHLHHLICNMFYDDPDECCEPQMRLSSLTVTLYTVGAAGGLISSGFFLSSAHLRRRWNGAPNQKPLRCFWWFSRRCICCRSAHPASVGLKKKASAELVQMRQRWREMDDVTTLSCWCCSLLLVRTEQAFTYTHTPHIEQQQSQDHQEGLFCRLTAKPNTH